MDRHMSNSLDNWITGHYGEDQFKGCDEYDEMVDHTCSNCICISWCPTFEKFCNGDDFDDCLIIQDIVNKQYEICSELSAQMERDLDEIDEDGQFVPWDEAKKELCYNGESELILKHANGIGISDDPDTNWNNNYLQFARLLSECVATGTITITDELCDSMDLTYEEIGEILERAQSAFDEVKMLFDDRELDSKLEKASWDDRMGA
jgi:hypothetical protein